MTPPDPDRQTCPKCGRTNFTAAGLVRHKCRPPGPGEPVASAAVAVDLAPAVIDATDAEVLDPMVEAGLALPPLPPVLMPVFDGIRDVHATIATKRAEVERYLAVRTADVSYDKVEIGWLLLRGKAAVAHGMTGNRNAAKDRAENPKTVAVSVSPTGFLGLVRSVFPEIQERTARNLMNAARNLGFTAASTLEQVRALRATKVFDARSLTTFYGTPAGELEEGDGASPEQAKRAAEIARWTAWSHDLAERGLDEKTWAYLPPDELEALDKLLLDLRREIGAALKETAQAKRGGTSR